jgi:hypothetical protein
MFIIIFTKKNKSKMLIIDALTHPHGRIALVTSGAEGFAGCKASRVSICLINRAQPIMLIWLPFRTKDTGGNIMNELFYRVINICATPLISLILIFSFYSDSFAAPDIASIYKDYQDFNIKTVISENISAVSKSNYKYMIKKMLNIKTNNNSQKATLIRSAIDLSVKAGDMNYANKYVKELEKLGNIPYGYPGDPLQYYGDDTILYAEPDSIMQRIKLADIKNNKKQVMDLSEKMLRKYGDLRFSMDVTTAGYADILLMDIMSKYADIKVIPIYESNIDELVLTLNDAIKNDKYDQFTGFIIKADNIMDKFNYGEESSVFRDPEQIALSLQYHAGDFYYLFTEMKYWLQNRYIGKYSLSYKNDSAIVDLSSNSPDKPMEYMSYSFKKIDGYWRLTSVGCRISK